MISPAAGRPRRGPVLRAFLLAGAVALLSTGAGIAAPASRTWTMSSVPVPQLPNGSLAAESCSGRDACTAVGSYDGPAGAARTLAEAWNGTSWSVQPSPDPAGAQGSVLDAISCRSPAACTAVGSYRSGSGTEAPLAEAWNGTAWRIQAPPSPAGSFGARLDGVSCPAAGACAAVGYHGANPLALTWNGTGWSSQHPPRPAGSFEAFLQDVSCAAPGGCTAVGYSDQDHTGNSLTLAEAWDGTAWSIQATPSRRGFQGSGLAGVSCHAAGTCTAVGSYFQIVPAFGDGGPLAEQRG